MLYLDRDREDERPDVEVLEEMAFGNVTDYSPEVYPVGDMAFLIGKRFCDFLLQSFREGLF